MTNSNMGYRSDVLRYFFTILSEDLEAASNRALDVTVKEAISRQSIRAQKRALIKNDSLREKATLEFIETNSKVGEVALSLDPDVLANARHFVTIVLERYTKLMVEDSIQEPFDYDLLFDSWRFGPGSSNGIRGSHCAQKITQDMTCTSWCIPHIRKLRRDNPYFQLNDERKGSLGYSWIRGSRLTTVQKNQDTDRTIAIEPSGNMVMQLAAGSYLEGALRFIGLDISTQQAKNKALAKRGSIDDSLATIDLKSASDMISLDLVRAIMPRRWFKLLLEIRSREIETTPGTWTAMNMVSTMGNGFTFPLMTLLLVALIYGYRATRGGKNLRIDWTDTAVYGDDIIVPSHEYPAICKVLSDAGLIVNTDKSYASGPFRESCGGDYYLGYDITPFYVKNLDDDSSIFVAINQMMEWSARHQVLLPNTIGWLKGQLYGRVLLIPEWHDPSEGVLSAQVQGRYKVLAVESDRKRLKESLFDMMLMAGGYVTSAGPNACYTPRVARPRRNIRKLRVPKGYRSGWDPRKRSQEISNRISIYIELLL